MGRRPLNSSFLSALVVPLLLSSPTAAVGGTEIEHSRGRPEMSSHQAGGGDPLVNIELTDGEGRRTEIGAPDHDAAADRGVEESDAILTPALGTGEFLVAGVTWAANEHLPRGSSVLARTLEGDSWSDWFEVGVEETPAGPGGDLVNGTEPFVTGGATAVQLRITGSKGELPADLALTVIPTAPDPDSVVSVSELPDVAVDPEAPQSAGPVSPSEPPTDIVELDVNEPVNEPSAGAPVAIGTGTVGTAVPAGLRQVAAELAANAAASTTPTLLPAAPTANTPAGTIVTREGWGADEAYTDSHWVPRYYKLEAAVVHHTAGTNTYTAAQSASIVKGIFVYHSQTRGWGDIGYNFLVDKYGQVFEGRKTSIQSKPGTPANQLVEGGHASAFNRGTLGISAMGNFDVTSAPSTRPIVTAISRVIAWKFNAAGIDPATRSPLLSPATRATSTYSTGTALPRIFGHEDVASTACPGSALRTELPALRSAVQALRAPSPSPANTAPVARAGTDQRVSADVTVTLDGSGSTDANGDVLTHSWVQTSGTTVPLTGAKTARPTFVAPRTAGDLAFRLTVSDGALTHTDTVVVTVVVGAPVSPFTDVTPTAPFYSDMVWLQEKGIATGWPDGSFRPAEPISRGAMAAFLFRLAGSPAFTAPTTSPYSDVTQATPFYKEITWLTAAGITTGFADGTFQPEASINRDAMAAFLHRFAGKPQFSAPAASPFTDLTPATMFYREITWLASTGVATGYPDGTFGPWLPVNRDAMAAFLHRFDSAHVPAPQPTAPNAIMGTSTLSAQRMATFALGRNSNPKISVTMLELAQLYLDEGAAEGVRGDVAFAQALHETGYFAFGGRALPEWNNYSGLGVTGVAYTPATATERVFTTGVRVILSASGASVGVKFEEPRLGVRAQIQHLKAYASTAPLTRTLVDPRFQYVTRGVAPTWVDLNGRWAVPGTTYGQQILSLHAAMAS